VEQPLGQPDLGRLVAGVRPAGDDVQPALAVAERVVGHRLDRVVALGLAGGPQDDLGPAGLDDLDPVGRRPGPGVRVRLVDGELVVVDAGQREVARPNPAPGRCGG
jgi:hypothetical protein